MRREIRAGRPSRRSSATLPDFKPDDPAAALRKFGPLHKAILDALAAAEAFGSVVTCARLCARLNHLGHATSEYEVRGKVNELQMLGMVRLLPGDELQRDSPVPVLGVVS